jgi:hypothetical protein
MPRLVHPAAVLLFAACAAAPKSVKVFVLAGQSNMEGQAVVDLDGPDYNGGKGTLRALLQDPAKAPMLRHLADGRGWAVRNDVFISYQPEDGPLQTGPLTVGFTPYADAHHFGPEFEFGHVVGDACDEPVLLIKTAWGGKSLYRDFRPPSSGGEVGPYYTRMLAEVRAAMRDPGAAFPGLAGRRCELAGFVWYQGWNDGCDPQHAVPEYEHNLVNLIADLRREQQQQRGAGQAGRGRPRYSWAKLLRRVYRIDVLVFSTHLLSLCDAARCCRSRANPAHRGVRRRQRDNSGRVPWPCDLPLPTPCSPMRPRCGASRAACWPATAPTTRCRKLA